MVQDFAHQPLVNKTLLSKTAGRFAGKSPHPMVAHACARTAVNAAVAAGMVAVAAGMVAVAAAMVAVAAAMVVMAAGVNMCIHDIKHILLLLRVVCDLRHGSGGSRHGSGGLGTQSFRGAQQIYSIWAFTGYYGKA